MVSSTEEIVEKLKVVTDFAVEFFPNRQTVLLEQIDAKLERIAAALEAAAPTVVTVHNPNLDYLANGARDRRTGLYEYYSLGASDNGD